MEDNFNVILRHFCFNCFWLGVGTATNCSVTESSASTKAWTKGNQPWIFIERTDAEAEASILWPPDVKSQLTGKDPDAGKDWGQEEKGMTEDEMVGWHHRFKEHELEQTLGDGEG